MSSASRIASRVSKKAGNSSQYKLKASWAPGPDSYSLHSPARKKWAKKVTYGSGGRYSYILHRTSKVFHCRKIEPRTRKFDQPRSVYVPGQPINRRTLYSPYYMLRVIFFCENWFSVRKFQIISTIFSPWYPSRIKSSFARLYRLMASSAFCGLLVWP